ncbi:MAG TPA: hypothetical protein PKN48_05350 [Bacteroidales bacterium]|nr:hypothetical protein [Bacteroidales bacterium]
MRQLLFSSLFLLLNIFLYSQNSDVNMADDEGIDQYNSYCQCLGGDSVRYCNGLRCSGQVKDYYPDGKVKHNGYYDQGKIATVFTNYYSNGNVERIYRAKSENRCLMESYHPNGKVKSKGEFIKGEMLKWEDYFENGQIEFSEEYNKGTEYHLYTHIYYENGNPKILFDLIDVKSRLYSYKEYYENGQVEEQGKKIQNKATRDYPQDGMWEYYNESGKLILVEEYVRGMLNDERKY